MSEGPLARLLPSGLARRFARAFIGLVAAALAANGAISMWLSYEEATVSAVGVQREKAVAAAELVAQFIGEIERQIGWTTRAEWARIGTEQRRYDFIRLLRQAPAISEALYIDGSGREQLRLSRLEPDVVGSAVDLSRDPRFVNAVSEKVWYGPVYFRRGSEPYMTISIAHAGRTPGVTSVGVNLKLAWDVITAIRVGQEGYAFVTDARGRLIAHPDMSLVLRDTDLSHLPQVEAAAKAAKGGAAGSPQTTRGPDGRTVLSASAAIPKLGWLVFVELPRSEVLAPVFTSLSQTLALLGAGILMALLLGGWLARRLAAPILALEATAQRLGEGDLTERVKVSSRDEIGRLAERFNGMAQQIQEARETLEQKVEDRTRALKESLDQQTATSEVLSVMSRSPSQAQPVFDAIAQSAERLFPGWAAELTLGPQIEADAAEGPGSRVRVPLLRKGAPIGAITLRHPQSDRDLTSESRALLETFADQAVIALENARLFEALQARTGELQRSLDDLRAAQDRLIQTEKLASLGQLTAGIAHEIKNPLNFVNNFSDLSIELATELEELLSRAQASLNPADREEAAETIALLKSNLSKVVSHGRRADSIVRNMLAHSREGGGERRDVDLNATVEEALNLAYHGLRAERPDLNVALERDYDPAVGHVSLYPQEFTRVVLNLVGNGFHAALAKARDPDAPSGFQPTLKVSTRAAADGVEIRVRDNGTGIPDAVKGRIFEPFFTTKPAGEGTGLGLSLSHDIVVKQHGGTLEVATEPGRFTEFRVVLPSGRPHARGAA
jgi:signal transduction histidine kinase